MSREKKFSSPQILDASDQLNRYGDELHLDLWYPTCDGNAKAVVVGLMHVRAADDIRISYDFGRDGYKIEMPTVHSWHMDDAVCDPKWKEICFVPSWVEKGAELPKED